MALVHNPNWIGFDGTPVTGRVPASVVMMAGDMTPALQAEVQHVYLMFCLAKNVAVVDYFVTDRLLSDGSRVRITSMQDRDTVQVWTRKRAEPLLLGYEALQFSWQQLRERVAEELQPPTWNGIYTTPKPSRYTDFDKTPDQGFVSWSSKHVMVGGRRIQVTYGQRPTGSYAFGLYGTDRLWIDGCRVKLFAADHSEIGLAIVAACMVKLSYAGTVGYVLRVMAVQSTDKSITFVDFGLRATREPIPNIGALGSTIELRERITRNGPPYWATDFYEAEAMPDFGWGDPLTRFCFNASGSKVACSAVLWDEAVETTRTEASGRYKGAGIVEIDVLSAALTKHYPCVREDSVTTHVDAATGYIGTISTSTVRARMVLLAVDYEDDELVWFWKKIVQQREAVYSKPNGASVSHSINDVYTTTAGHSRLGQLLEIQHASGCTINGAATGPATAGGAISWRGGYKYMDVSFGGDLSRGGFCIGYATELSMEVPSGAYLERDDGQIVFSGVDMPVKRVRMQFDVYLRNRRVGTGFPGPSVLWDDDWRYVSAQGYFTAVDGEIVVRDVGRGGTDLYGISSQPSDNGTFIDRTKLRLGVVPASNPTGSPLLANVLPTDVAGFYNQLDAPAVICAVAPSGNAIYMDSMDVPHPLVGLSYPGLCHLLRQGAKGVEWFELAYEGYTTADPPMHYILAATGGLFLNHRRTYA